jgi:hypothetical protein
MLMLARYGNELPVTDPELTEAQIKNVSSILFHRAGNSSSSKQASRWQTQLTYMIEFMSNEKSFADAISNSHHKWFQNNSQETDHQTSFPAPLQLSRQCKANRQDDW